MLAYSNGLNYDKFIILNMKHQEKKYDSSTEIQVLTLVSKTVHQYPDLTLMSYTTQNKWM